MNFIKSSRVISDPGSGITLTVFELTEEAQRGLTVPSCIHQGVRAMDTKPGIKTPAFALTALATFLTYLLGSEVLGGGRDAQVVSLAISTLGSIGYTTWRAVKKKDGETRPMWKTSEFWLSAAAAICGGLYAAGAFGPDTRPAQILGGAMALLAALGYGVQSAPTKKGAA